MNAFKLETIAVSGLLLFIRNSQQASHNVSNVKCLVLEVELSQMRQQIVHEDVHNCGNRLRFRKVSNVLNSRFLCENRTGIVNTRSKHLQIMRILVNIKETVLYDVLVADNTECAHENKKRHWFANIGHIHDDVAALERTGAGHDAHRQFANGFGDVLRN